MLKQTFNYNISKGHLSEMLSGITSMNKHIEEMLSSIMIDEDNVSNNNKQESTTHLNILLPGRKLPPYIPSMLISN
jgi:hypothetical protein